MIEKQWAVAQIRDKWRKYITLENELIRLERQYWRDHNCLHPDGDKMRLAVRHAHRDYQTTMYPLKQMFNINWMELQSILRAVEEQS